MADQGLSAAIDLKSATVGNWPNFAIRERLSSTHISLLMLIVGCLLKHSFGHSKFEFWNYPDLSIMPKMYVIPPSK
jgi:hypothetical protein